MKQDEIARLEGLLDGPLSAMAYPMLAEAHRRAGRPEEAERVAREGLRGAAPATSGHIALALALLDQKRGDEARAELESLLGAGTEHAIAGEAAERSQPGFPGAEDTDSQASASPWSASAASALPEVEPVTPVEPPVAGPFGPPPPPAPAEALVFEGDVDDDELDDAFDEAESDREQMIGADDVAHAALSAVLDEEDDDLEEEPEGDGLALADPTSPFATETVADLLTQQGHTEEAEEVRARLAESPVEPAPAGVPLAAIALQPLAPADVPDPEPLEAPVGIDPSDSPVTPFEEPEVAAPEPVALDPEPIELDGATGPERPRQQRTQATLERWLDNLRRDRP